MPNVRVIITHSSENFHREVLSIKRSEELADAIKGCRLSMTLPDCDIVDVIGASGKVNVTMSRDLTLIEAEHLYEVIGDIAFTYVGARPPLLRTR